MQEVVEKLTEQYVIQDSDLKTHKGVYGLQQGIIHSLCLFNARYIWVPLGEEYQCNQSFSRIDQALKSMRGMEGLIFKGTIEEMIALLQHIPNQRGDA